MADPDESFETAAPIGEVVRKFQGLDALTQADTASRVARREARDRKLAEASPCQQIAYPYFSHSWVMIPHTRRVRCSVCGAEKGVDE